MSGEARPKPLMSVAGAAKLIGVAPTTAYEWARRDELPGLVKIGNRLYVKRAVLLAWLAGEDIPTMHGPMHSDMPHARHTRAAEYPPAAQGGR